MIERNIPMQRQRFDNGYIVWMLAQVEPRGPESLLVDIVRRSFMIDVFLPVLHRICGLVKGMRARHCIALYVVAMQNKQQVSIALQIPRHKFHPEAKYWLTILAERTLQHNTPQYHTIPRFNIALGILGCLSSKGTGGCRVVVLAS